MNRLIAFASAILFFLTALSFSKETGFTQEDRERLIRLETTLKVFMEQTNRRFEELRQDMNKRFELIDKRFEDINNRIIELRGDMNKRFEQLYTFLWIITGIFTTLIASVIAFAWWDRKTIIRKTKEETFEEMEKEIKPEKFKKLLNALREKAKTDKDLAEILKRYGLL